MRDFAPNWATEQADPQPEFANQAAARSASAGSRAGTAEPSSRAGGTDIFPQAALLAGERLSGKVSVWCSRERTLAPSPILLSLRDTDSSPNEFTPRATSPAKNCPCHPNVILYTHGTLVGSTSRNVSGTRAPSMVKSGALTGLKTLSVKGLKVLEFTRVEE